MRRGVRINRRRRELGGRRMDLCALRLAGLLYLVMKRR
jgi:hypothetical protein